MYDPNIILFQEYKTKSRRSILDQYDDFGYAFTPNIIINSHMSGLINASKFKVKEYSSIFSENVEPIIKTPKVSFLTKYLLKNSKYLTVINIHMINFVKIDKFLDQMAQIEKLCFQSDEALILCGDFNTWSNKRMRILVNMTKECSLSQVSFKENQSKKALSLPTLDHIFYRGVKFIDSKILHDINTSDHKPMIASFDII
jgi:endonuclease/exonuclease/phosphatase (EEP) superfamily protein YafD